MQNTVFHLIFGRVPTCNFFLIKILTWNNKKINVPQEL